MRSPSAITTPKAISSSCGVAIAWRQTGSRRQGMGRGVQHPWPGSKQSAADQDCAAEVSQCVATDCSSRCGKIVLQTHRQLLCEVSHERVLQVRSVLCAQKICVAAQKLCCVAKVALRRCFGRNATLNEAQHKVSGGRIRSKYMLQVQRVCFVYTSF